MTSFTLKGVTRTMRFRATESGKTLRYFLIDSDPLIFLLINKPNLNPTDLSSYDS